MNFIQKIATYSLGLSKDKDLPLIALQGIEDGYCSETLYMLAGMDESENGFKLFDYLKQTLSELNISFPDRQTAMIQIVQLHAYNIANYITDPYDGMYEIAKIIDKTAFDWDDIKLWGAYGYYIAINEVYHDEMRLPYFTKKTDYYFEQKMNIINEMRVWLENNPFMYSLPQTKLA